MIEIKGLSRIYSTKAGTVKALDNVNLELESTGMVFILGKSGSGKSTLLNVLGGLDKFDAGEIIIKGKSSKDFSGSDFDSYRNTFIGFIFQDYNILNDFTVAGNIGLALELQGKKATKEAVDRIISDVDMQGYGERKPATLSGGQKQRVAIARALIKEPEIIMADEPTGALDSNTGKQVFETLKKLSKTKLVLVVSHDRENAEFYGDRIIELKDGQIISDIKKYLAPPQGTGAISIVDNKIVTIKAGYKLTDRDTDILNRFMATATEDVVISIDKKSNEQFKRIAKIDNSGNKESFANTRREQLRIKKYDVKDFRLIKSKLPFRDSFKMGASGLKAKPIRLVFTILLCAIAFTLFGLADTMAAYNKVDTAVTTMQSVGINYAAVARENKVTQYNYTYWNSANLFQEDIDALNERFSELNFKPVYTFSSDYWSREISFNDNIHTQSDLPSPYYKRSFFGITELTNEERIDFGFEFLAGEMPKADNEIVVTKFIYEQFNLAGYKKATDKVTVSTKQAVESPDKLISKVLTMYDGNDYSDFKIVGVIDTNFDDSRYESLKNPSSSGGMMDWILQMEFESLMLNSHHALIYANVGYFDVVKSNNPFMQLGNNCEIMAFLQTDKPQDPFMGSNKWSDFNVNKLGTLSTIDSNAVIWKDGTPRTELAENEAIITIPQASMKEIVLDDDTTVRLDIGYAKGLAQNTIANELNQFDSVAGKTEWDKLKEQNAELAELFYDAYQYAAYLVYDEEYMLANIYENIAFQAKEGYLGNWGTDFMDSFPTLENYLARFDNYGGFSVNQFEPSRIGSDYVMAEIMPIARIFFADPEYSTLQLGYSLNYSERFFGDDAKELNIVGISFLEDYNLLIANQAILETFEDFVQGDFTCTISLLPDDTALLRDLVEYTYTDGETMRFVLKNPVSSTLITINSMIEQLAVVFLWVGVGFAVFASLMMLNFIATSISYKKREIGILRAVGARGSDVLGIFFNESMIITLINFTLAVIATVVVSMLINSSLLSGTGLLITLLMFGPRQVALMLGISILVAFISSALPVTKIARMRPIDAIKQG